MITALCSIFLFALALRSARWFLHALKSREWGSVLASAIATLALTALAVSLVVSDAKK